MPEAAVSITAALQENAGITIGNIVGSNILNILIILGVTALITNVAIQKSTLYYEIPYMIAITLSSGCCSLYSLDIFSSCQRREIRRRMKR